MAKVWVTMTDKFMSNWGMAKNKINKVVVECDNMAEAIVVEKNAMRRHEMKNVNVCLKKPYYSNSRYCVSEYNKERSRGWFVDHPEWN